MSDAPEFSLTHSPPDPQPVKVFELDDCTWWAGYSLEQCIADARRQHGDDCYEDAEECGRECTAEEMRALTTVDDRECSACEKRTFAAELARRVAAGEQFPQFFACTEY